MGDYITPEDYSRAVEAMGLKGAQDWVRKNNITIADGASGGLPPQSVRMEARMEDEGELPPVGAEEEDAGTEVTLSASPSAGGLGSLDAVNAAQKVVTDRIKANIDLFTDAQRRLRERRVGPSNAEKWLAIAAALGKPTRTGSFGESLGNLSETLGEQQAARRKAAEEREMLLEQYGLKIGTEELRLAQANAAQAAQAYRAQVAANKPGALKSVVVENGVAFDPISGEKIVQPNDAAWAALVASPTKENYENFIRTFGPRFAEKAQRLIGYTSGGQ